MADLPKEAVEYFCYISRSKVDQLFHALAPRDADEWTEHSTNERAFGGNLSADLNLARIFSLFKGGATYGRKGVIQREQKLKIEYVEKLRRVLLAIAAQSPIPSLTQAVRTGDFESLYYHHDGVFRVESPVSAPNAASVVAIQTEIEGTVLLLDCGLRFFSEGPLPDGTFVLNSSNARFFSGGLALSMSTVFLVLEANPKRVVGSPLFLKLSLQRSDRTHLDRLTAL